MYVAVADRSGNARAVYHVNPEVTTTAEWQRWTIPLSRFAERDFVLWPTSKKPSRAVYSFLSSNVSGNHSSFCAASEEERDEVLHHHSKDWVYSGIAFYSEGASPGKTQPVRRFRRTWQGAETYLYTRDPSRIAALEDAEIAWEDEGVVFSVYPPASKSDGRREVYDYWSQFGADVCPFYIPISTWILPT